MRKKRNQKNITAYLDSAQSGGILEMTQKSETEWCKKVVASATAPFHPAYKTGSTEYDAACFVSRTN